MKRFLYCIIIILTFSCKERFEPPAVSKGTNYLVVEGFINTGQGATNIRLSRTLRLSDSAAVQPELGAQVMVEDSNHIQYPLYETGNGTYAISQLYLNNNIRYRVHIKTYEGGEYVSDFVAVRQTPPIDSVSWKKNSDVLQIMVSTHDPKNSTWYYKWDYTETWEYHSVFRSNLIYANGQLMKRDSSNSIFRCWHIVNSSAITLGSSAKLSQDVIANMPLATISKDDYRLSLLYSIFVQQYALDKAGYEYWTLLKKNTEQLGSIFDAQPSELTGNIHCVNNPQEVVIGYINAGSVTSKRIFISYKDLDPWFYPTPFTTCTQSIVPGNHPDSVQYYFGTYSNFYTPLDSIYIAGQFVGIGRADIDCADCRTQGGTNVKPTYWPF